MDTVIVGNGILALTAAFRLAKASRPHDTIRVIGPRARPGSATLAAAAMLNSFAEVEADTLASDVEFFRFELSHRAARMWPAFILDIIRAAGSRLPGACAACQGPCGGCFDTGTFVVDSPFAEDPNFDAVVSALEQFDEPHEVISPREIPGFQPDAGHAPKRAVYIRNEGWINPRLTLDALEAALASFPNVTIFDGEVHRFIASGTRITAVELADGQRIEGETFLLAAGASSTDLLLRSELHLPIMPVFYGIGVSLELQRKEALQKHCIRTVNRESGYGLYSVPYFKEPNQPRDHVLLGATSSVSALPCTNARIGDIEGLARRARQEIHTAFANASLVRVNLGWRPTSEDTYPLIGKTSLANLVIATGTKRDGFHLAPLLSEAIVACLLGRPVDDRFAMFAPERKPLRAITREQAITKALRYRTRDSHEARADLERLHDAVGAHEWGIPFDLLALYRDGHLPRAR
jgi:glycine/D-amino acid oxidase-like deaminating enzyme